MVQRALATRGIAPRVFETHSDRLGFAVYRMMPPVVPVVTVELEVEIAVTVNRIGADGE